MSKQRTVATVVSSALLTFGILTILCNYRRLYYFGLNLYAAVASVSTGPLTPAQRYQSWIVKESNAIAALCAMPIIGAVILKKPRRLVGGLVVLALIETVNVLAKLYWEGALQAGAGYGWSAPSLIHAVAEMFRGPILFIVTAVVARTVLCRDGDPPICANCGYRLNSLSEPLVSGVRAGVHAG